MKPAARIAAFVQAWNAGVESRDLEATLGIEDAAVCAVVLRRFGYALRPRPKGRRAGARMAACTST